MNLQQKKIIRLEIQRCLGKEGEIAKVVIFGSFLTSDQPNDLDIAVFQTSQEDYIPLALKYRRLLRNLASQIPLDVIPVKAGASGALWEAVQQGEVVFER